jgi:hypothetical protein
MQKRYIFPYLLSKKYREGLKEALRIVKELQGMCSGQFAIEKTMP